MSVRLTLLGPDGRVLAERQLDRSEVPAPGSDPAARRAERLASHLTRGRPVRARAVCVAERPVPRSGIII
jgi:hypothetical protein